MVRDLLYCTILQEFRSLNSSLLSLSKGLLLTGLFLSQVDHLVFAIPATVQEFSDKALAQSSTPFGDCMKQSGATFVKCRLQVGATHTSKKARRSPGSLTSFDEGSLEISNSEPRSLQARKVTMEPILDMPLLEAALKVNNKLGVAQDCYDTSLKNWATGLAVRNAGPAASSQAANQFVGAIQSNPATALYVKYVDFVANSGYPGNQEILSCTYRFEDLYLRPQDADKFGSTQELGERHVRCCDEPLRQR